MGRNGQAPFGGTRRPRGLGMRTAPAILIIGILVLVWQGYRLRYRAGNLGSWAITIALFAILSSVALRIFAEPGNLLATLNPVIRILLVNIVITVAALALHLFRLHVAGCSIASRSAQAAISTAVTVAVLLTVLAIGLASSGSALNYADTSLRRLPVAAFYLIAGGYFSYVLAGSSLWAFGATRRTSGHVRVGMFLTGIGTGLVCTYCIVNALFVAIVYFGGPHFTVPAGLATIANTIAAPSLVLGLMLPFLVGRLRAFSTWWWQLRAYYALGPLWQVANALHPEFALNSSERSSAEAASSRPPRGVAYRFRRRRAECYDALAKVRGHLDGHGVTNPAGLALVEVLQQRPDLVQVADQEEPPTSVVARTDTDRLVEISRELGRVGSTQRP